MSVLYDRLEKITTLIFDVDGVFTDSTLLITEQGEFLRSMNVRDGYAIKKAVSADYNLAIITGGGSIGVEKRLRGLGITEVHSRIKDKLSVLNDVIDSQNLSPDEILYIGDDEIDIPCLKLVGVACCPKDADPSVQKHVDYICHKEGGKGCVREIVQMVMEAQGKWNSEI